MKIDVIIVFVDMLSDLKSIKPCYPSIFSKHVDLDCNYRLSRTQHLMHKVVSN
jgi:hypothetical protein